MADGLCKLLGYTTLNDCINAFHQAIDNDDVQRVKVLRAVMQDIHCCHDDRHRNFLMRAVCSGRAKVVRELLPDFMDHLEDVDVDGLSALKHAIQIVSQEIVALLLKAGAQVEETALQQPPLPQPQPQPLSPNNESSAEKRAKTEAEDNKNVPGDLMQINLADLIQLGDAELLSSTEDKGVQPSSLSVLDMARNISAAEADRDAIIGLILEAKIQMTARVGYGGKLPKNWEACHECETLKKARLEALKNTEDVRKEVASLEMQTAAVQSTPAKNNKHHGWCIHHKNDKDIELRHACHIVPLDNASDEYQAILKKWKKQTKSLNLINVWRVQNPEAHMAYELERAKMLMRNQDPNEKKELFHTTRGSLETLLAEGMDARVSTSGLLGSGIYATDNVLKASAYWKVAVNRRSMLQVSMLLGNCERVPDSQSRRYQRRETRGYDSLQGRFTGQEEFVTYHSTRVHIDYVLDYEVTTEYVDEATKIIKVTTPPTQQPPPNQQPQQPIQKPIQQPPQQQQEKQPLPQAKPVYPPSILTKGPAMPSISFASTRQGNHGITAWAVSKCGRIIVTATVQGDVHVWEASEPLRFVYRGCMSDCKTIHKLAMHPRRRLVAVASDDNVVRLVNLETLATMSARATNDAERLQASVSSIEKKLEGHTSCVTSVAFSNDGKTLASASDDESILIWNLETYESVKKLCGHFAGINSLAFSPDDTKLASASNDNSICIWHVQTTKFDPAVVLRGHTDAVLSVAFQKEQNLLLVSGSKDHNVRIWNTDTGNCTSVCKGHTGVVHCVAFSPENSSIITSCSDDNSIRTWNIVFGQTTQTISTPVGAIAYLINTTGARILSSSPHHNTMSIWDAKTGTLVQTTLCHDKETVNEHKNEDKETEVNSDSDSDSNSDFSDDSNEDEDEED